MSQAIIDQTGWDVIYLALCAIKGVAPERERIQNMDLQAVYAMARRHQISAAIAMALESAGFGDDQSDQEIALSVSRMTLFDAERAKVLEQLERAGIWYMPLKGTILNQFYPCYGMRQMADQDILYDPERRDDIRGIMEGLNFTPVQIDLFHHDEYQKPPYITFEMHWALLSRFMNQAQFLYYQNIRERLVKDEGNACGYHFTDEDFYIYMMVHSHKHYSGRGMGLRMILDICVYLNRFEREMDWDYIEGELEKTGILGFERQSRSLAGCLYRDEALSPDDEEMLGVIVASGVYGTMEHMFSNRIGKLDGSMKSKLKYAFDRVFPSMDYIEASHPFFYRHKALLPFLTLWRVLKALTVYRSLIFSELRMLFKKKRTDTGPAPSDGEL